MDIPVSEAKAQLITGLVRRTAASEDNLLSRHGQQVFRFAPTKRLAPMAAEKMALVESIVASGHAMTGAPEDTASSPHWL